jgi:hypothetical protein
MLSSLKMQLARAPQVHYFEVEEHEREKYGFGGSGSRGGCGGGGVNGDKHGDRYAAADVGVGYIPTKVKENFQEETAQQQPAHAQGLLPQALPARGGAAYGGLAGGGPGIGELPRRRMPSITASPANDNDKFVCL